MDKPDDLLLENSIDDARKEVKTDSYPMSIGEISSMYERGEIILRPEYQRYFRWENEQKSKLIESILIGLPLPSVFMSQDHEGNWEVVDGMQRLSTIFDYMGLLSQENTKSEFYERFEHLSDDMFYLPKFVGLSWNELSRRIQLDFKRTKLQLTILLRETNADAKFELFQRLNSGGTSISGQELRNAIMAGEDNTLLQWFEELAQQSSFVKVCGLAPREQQSRFDVELVLRFVALMTEKYLQNLKGAKSVDVFLTDSPRKILEDDDFDRKYYNDLFLKTFDLILKSYGENALKYKNKPGTGKFSISFFEAVVFGIAKNIDENLDESFVRDKINNIGQTNEFIDASGSGKNAQKRIPLLIELGRSTFKPV